MCVSQTVDFERSILAESTAARDSPYTLLPLRQGYDLTHHQFGKACALHYRSFRLGNKTFFETLSTKLQPDRSTTLRNIAEGLHNSADRCLVEASKI